MKVDKAQQILERMRIMRMRIEHLMKVSDAPGWDTSIITQVERQHRFAQMNTVIEEIEKIIER